MARGQAEIAASEFRAEIGYSINELIPDYRSTGSDALTEYGRAFSHCLAVDKDRPGSATTNRLCATGTVEGGQIVLAAEAEVDVGISTNDTLVTVAYGYGIDVAFRIARPTFSTVTITTDPSRAGSPFSGFDLSLALAGPLVDYRVHLTVLAGTNQSEVLLLPDGEYTLEVGVSGNLFQAASGVSTLRDAADIRLVFHSPALQVAGLTPTNLVVSARDLPVPSEILLESTTNLVGGAWGVVAREPAPAADATLAFPVTTAAATAAYRARLTAAP